MTLYTYRRGKPLGGDYVTGQFVRRRYIIEQVLQAAFNVVCLDNLLCVYPLILRRISTKMPKMFLANSYVVK